MSFPYTYYRCSCTTTTPIASNAGADQNNGVDDDEGDEDETFDPSNPRSNYSLYPHESLMWCDDCHDVRCSRCTVEEIVCWYCPNCLFEVPSSTIKQEGNRCTRNCFQCPECTALLQTLSLDPDPSSAHGPFILNCTFCNWNSLDVGLKFDSPRHILEQLQKNVPSRSQRRVASRTGTTNRLETVAEPTGPQGASGSNTPRDASPNTVDARKPQDTATRFMNLKNFYKEQMGKSSLGDSIRSPGGGENYSSPNSLQHIMNLYSSTSGSSSSHFGRKQTEKAKLMREVSDVSEGMSLFSSEADIALVAKLREASLSGTASMSQRANQSGEVTDMSTARFLSDLKPVPTLLCTKRSSRCSICRHILVKPEPKVNSTRFRIRLVATDRVPRLSLKPLATPHATNGSGSPTKNSGSTVNMADVDLKSLPARQTLQFLLKLTNPMFDSVKVSLATPAEVPSSHGRGPSRVTILCPEFEIGANSDMWDEALGTGRGGRDRDGEGDGKTAVAGRVWERGRNWTTVVVEVVPEKPKEAVKGGDGLEEDQDVLEIPIFVRLTYETDLAGEDGGAGKERREKRSLSYWAVLGAGRTALS